MSDALEQWRLPDLAETAELLVSELVTNSVNALGKVDRRIIDASTVIVLKIRTDYHSLLVEVWDRSADLPQVVKRLRRAGKTSPGVFRAGTAR